MSCIDVFRKIVALFRKDLRNHSGKELTLGVGAAVEYSLHICQILASLMLMLIAAMLRLLGEVLKGAIWYPLGQPHHDCTLLSVGSNMM